MPAKLHHNSFALTDANTEKLYSLKTLLMPLGVDIRRVTCLHAIPVLSESNWRALRFRL
jgi:aminoglycoside N3'-acetyltransferase